MSIARNSNVELSNSPDKKSARETDNDADCDADCSTVCDNPDDAATVDLFVAPLADAVDRAGQCNRSAVLYCKTACECAINALKEEKCNEAADLAKHLEIVSTNLMKALEENVGSVTTSGKATLDGFEQVHRYWLKKAEQASRDALRYADEGSAATKVGWVVVSAGQAEE